MTSYKIYLGLETKRGQVIDINEVYLYLSKLGIEYATVIETIGFYKGTLEKSCIIEIIKDFDADNERETRKLINTIHDIKENFRQEEIMLVKTNINTSFIL